VPNQKGRNRKEEEAERDVVSTISFIQTNLQDSVAASRILTRTVSIKGIDIALIQDRCITRTILWA
jgi:hypothetical protein